MKDCSENPFCCTLQKDCNAKPDPTARPKIKDTNYFYYLHGPMARVETGHHKVQGTDYAYTLHGWIKGVNSTILESKNDIAKDAYNWNTINSYNSKDVYSYSLNYFNNTTEKDYKAINGVTGSTSVDFIADVSSAPNQTPDLYNGNIRQMATTYRDAAAPGKSYNPSGLLRNFSYDQLNRITSVNATDELRKQNMWQAGTITGIYDEAFTYDQNGNILRVNRNGNQGGSALNMDGLTYSYLPNTNKLDYVDDAVTGDPYSGDISSQSSGNYQYDAIGNLVSDVAEDIVTIDWTVYGKIKQITKGSGTEIRFNYDASGNRISKTVFDGSTGNVLATYYVRDAQGNTMAVYEKAKKELYLREQHLYGSSRLGLNLCNLNTDLLADTSGFYTRALGFKNYELSNHLGNVIATISDRKIGVDDDADHVLDYFTAEVMNATDYYAFGSPMPGRNFTSSGYRYGFNGKEKDDEVKGGGNSVDFGDRMYDPRIGRWSSTDSRISKYPNMSPYNFGMNNPIIFMDIDGNDVIVAFQGGPFGGGKTITADNNTSAYNIVAQAESDAMAKNIEFNGTVIGPGYTSGAAVNNAYDFIKANYTAGEKLVIYGYSYGGDPAIELAEKLKADGIIVDLLVTVDATDGPLRNTTVSSEIPDNVTTNINLYQTDNDGSSSSSHFTGSSSEKSGSGSSGSSNGSSNSDSGSSDFPGSHGNSNTAKDPSKTKVINKDLSSPNVNHGNISAISQNPISRIINRILGTGENKNPYKAKSSGTGETSTATPTYSGQ